MEDWVDLALRGDTDICWYDLYRESNPGRSDGSTMVYPLCYRWNVVVVYNIFCPKNIYKKSWPKISLHQKLSFPLRIPSVMWPNPQFSEDLVTFIEEILEKMENFIFGVMFTMTPNQKKELAYEYYVLLTNLS